MSNGLRDMYAAKALQGLLAHEGYRSATARLAFKVADAMLLERGDGTVFARVTGERDAAVTELVGVRAELAGVREQLDAALEELARLRQAAA